MRKILTVATGILLLAASCSKEADNETKLPAPGENQIRATIEPVFSDATTRSEFDSNMKIIWSPSDQIGVMTPEKPDANMTYVIREQEHCSAGIFTLDADIKLESDTFYAYYPRTANDCCMTDEAELSLVLPAVQTYKKNSFATNANIAVAVSTDGREYAFRNACSYLDVKLQGDGIVLDKIVITAGKDTSLPNQKLYLAGSGKVCFNDYDSEPVFELDGSSDNNRSITLNCDNVALEADAPTDFYFVMPAGTYSGITVDVYTADGQKISYVKGLLGEGLVFERNTVNSFKVETITTAPTDEVEEVDNVYTVSTPQQWNWLAAQVDTGNTFEGKTITLAQDLDFDGIEFISMGMEADYMTDTSLPLHPFQGTIEGNGRTISNVNLSSDGRACGIIGYGRECTVRNLTLSDITVTGAGKWKGALVGYLWNGTVENVHLINALIHPYEETLPQEPYRYSYRIGGMIGFWSGDKDAAISNVSIRNAEVHGSYAIAGLIGGIQGTGRKTIDNAATDGITVTNHGIPYMSGSDCYFDSAALLGDCTNKQGELVLTNITIGSWALYDQSDESVTKTLTDQTWCHLPYVGEMDGNSPITLDSASLSPIPVTATEG